MSAISAGLGALIDGLANPESGGGRNVTLEDLQLLGRDIALALSIIKDTMDEADRKTTEAVTAATDAATQIEEVGQNVSDITHHTYEQVLPHSLSWTIGYVWSHGITPLTQRMNKAESDIRFLKGWREQIITWRTKFVDPNVEKWIGWHEWFVTWPQGVLFKWHDWFEHPTEFARWAAPPLIGPLVSYLAAPGHQASRDNLSLIITSAWQEVPNRTWELMLQYMVTDK